MVFQVYGWEYQRAETSCLNLNAWADRQHEREWRNVWCFAATRGAPDTGPTELLPHRQTPWKSPKPLPLNAERTRAEDRKLFEDQHG